MATQFLDQTWHQDPRLTPVEVQHPKRRVRLGWIVAAVLVLLVGAGIGYLSHSPAKTTSSNRGSPGSGTAATQGTTTVPASSTTASTVASTTTATSAPSSTAASFDFNDATQTVNQLGFNVITVAGSQEQSPGALNALIGQCVGSATGYCENAFFFVGDKYIGTDISGRDIAVQLSWQTDDMVALSYPLYAPSDPHCCPTGGLGLCGSNGMEPPLHLWIPFLRIRTASLGSKQVCHEYHIRVRPKWKTSTLPTLASSAPIAS